MEFYIMPISNIPPLSAAVNTSIPKPTASTISQLTPTEPQSIGPVTPPIVPPQLLKVENSSKDQKTQYFNSTPGQLSEINDPLLGSTTDHINIHDIKQDSLEKFAKGILDAIQKEYKNTVNTLQDASGVSKKEHQLAKKLTVFEQLYLTIRPNWNIAVPGLGAGKAELLIVPLELIKMSYQKNSSLTKDTIAKDVVHRIKLLLLERVSTSKSVAIDVVYRIYQRGLTFLIDNKISKPTDTYAEQLAKLTFSAIATVPLIMIPDFLKVVSMGAATEGAKSNLSRVLSNQIKYPAQSLMAAMGLVIRNPPSFLLGKTGKDASEIIISHFEKKTNQTIDSSSRPILKNILAAALILYPVLYFSPFDNFKQHLTFTADKVMSRVENAKKDYLNALKNNDPNTNSLKRKWVRMDKISRDFKRLFTIKPVVDCLRESNQRFFRPLSTNERKLIPPFFKSTQWPKPVSFLGNIENVKVFRNPVAIIKRMPIPNLLRGGIISIGMTLAFICTQDVRTAGSNAERTITNTGIPKNTAFGYPYPPSAIFNKLFGSNPYN
jgi:hypothetical protein